MLVVPAASPYKTVADVVAALKASPDKMTFASSGNGSSDHLTAELFWLQTGTSGTHLPYKGGAPAISDLLGGQVDAVVPERQRRAAAHPGGQAEGAGGDGRQALAGAAERADAGRGGRQGADVYSWQAVVAPWGLPADVKAKMVEALSGALNDPKVRQQFVGRLRDRRQHAEQFAAFQQQENARWKHRDRDAQDHRGLMPPQPGRAR